MCKMKNLGIITFGGSSGNNFFLNHNFINIWLFKEKKKEGFNGDNNLFEFVINL